MELVLDDEEIGAVHETPPYVHRQRSERVKKNSKCLADPLKRLSRVFFLSSTTADFPVFDIVGEDHLLHLMSDAVGQGFVGCDDFLFR